MLQQFTNTMLGAEGIRKGSPAMIQLSQNDAFLSPRTEPAEEPIAIFLRQKFAKLHHRQRQQIMKNVFHHLYGRHNAVDYKEEYNFQERWQEQSKPTFFDNTNKIVKAENFMPPFIQFSLLLLYTSIIWFLSIYRLFNASQLVFIFLPITLLTQLKDVFLKNYFIRKASNQNNFAKSRNSWIEHIKLHWSNLAFVPYCVFIAIENANFNSEKNLYLSLIDYFFIWRAYLRLDELYSGIKIRVMASKYRNELQVIQLLARCIFVIHVFGIIFFFVAQTHNNQNWTLSVNDFNYDWITKYIYSLYFASTTLTTVGYGDITPKNSIEITTILFTQIFGIINFGFIVNEIGRILSKINEKQEILTKNISQAQNIAETYKIPEILALKMRNFIINNQIAHDQLNVEEEDSFMRKLNDQIREGFNSLHHIRIIKSSIFFLCRWSKKFQRNIASKLVRNIYSPQETLCQNRGKQKLYILTRGKIDVIACLADHQQPLTIRPLKVIEIHPENEVQFNVYGYSQLISGHRINLKAVVRDYSICYTLVKEDFSNCIIEDQRDFEYFHEIRAKIQQSYFRQLWQTPNIINTRQHYLPNPFYVIMKKKHKAEKNRFKRRSILRKRKKTKCYIQSQVQASSQEIDSQDSETHAIKSENILENIVQHPVISAENKILDSKERQAKYNNVLNTGNKCLVNNRGYSHKPGKKIKFVEDEDERKKLEEIGTKQLILNNFEQSYKFGGYFPKFNLTQILEKHQKQYNVKNHFLLRSQKSLRLDPKNQIPQDVMEKLQKIRVFGSQSMT